VDVGQAWGLGAVGCNTGTGLGIEGVEEGCVREGEAVGEDCEVLHEAAAEKVGGEHCVGDGVEELGRLDQRIFEG
jgi:hypothetical protein